MKENKLAASLAQDVVCSAEILLQADVLLQLLDDHVFCQLRRVASHPHFSLYYSAIYYRCFLTL